MSVLYTFIIATAILYIYLRYRKRKQFLDSVKHLDGPLALPLFGNYFALSSPKDFLPNLLKYQKKYGDIYRLFLGPSSAYMVISDPDLMEIVLTSNRVTEKSKEYRFLEKCFGNGLLTAPGHIWCTHKKLLAPVLATEVPQHITSQLKTSIDNLLAELDFFANARVDIYPIIKDYLLDAICESTLGVSFNVSSNRQHPITSCFALWNSFSKRIFNPFKHVDFLYKFTKASKEETSNINILHNICREIINKKRNNEPIGDNDDMMNNNAKSFLDLLIESEIQGLPLSDAEILDELVTFILGAHQSMTSAVSFTLYMLGQNRKIQCKVQNELSYILGDEKDVNPTLEDLKRMEYLEMVIKESLRLYPSVPITGRKTVVRDFECKGFLIPKEINVAVNIYGLHRNPKYFPDPEKFDPSRFSPSMEAKRHPYAYVPFSAGPRACVGKNFAMISLKYILAKLLTKHEYLDIERKVTTVHKIFLEPEYDVTVLLKRRLPIA